MAANLCIACVPITSKSIRQTSGEYGTCVKLNAINPKRTKKAKAKVPITEPIFMQECGKIKDQNRKTKRFRQHQKYLKWVHTVFLRDFRLSDYDL